MTAQQPIRVDVAAGQDAQTRIDDGAERPGDRYMADLYERWCWQDSYLDACWRQEQAERYDRAVADHRPDCPGVGDCDHWTHEEAP